jgi:hypothetical protein
MQTSSESKTRKPQPRFLQGEVNTRRVSQEEAPKAPIPKEERHWHRHEKNKRQQTQEAVGAGREIETHLRIESPRTTDRCPCDAGPREEEGERECV